MTTPTDLIEDGKVLMEDINNALKAYQESTEALQEAFKNEQKAQREFIQMSDAKMLEYSPTLAGVIDPRTNRANKEWTDMKLRELLDSDVEYSQAEANALAAEHTRSQAVDNRSFVVETLGALKAQSRLLAAMLSALES